MKKNILIGCILLLTACRGAASNQTEEVSPSTLIPTLEPVPSTTDLVPTATIPPPLYFTDEFDTVSPYWEIFQTGGMNAPIAAVENGSLRIGISSQDTWSIGIHNAHTYANVFLRTKVTTNTAGSVGLICRYEENGWYEFNIASDGTYSILFGQWLDSGIAQYKPIVTDVSRHLSEGGLDYEIGLHCEGDFLHLYANDSLIRNLDVTNFGLGEGRVGITASSFGEIPMTALFEWVEVGTK